MGIDPLSKHLLSGSGQQGPLALMYHAVSPGKSYPQWPWAVSLHRFIQQLELLRKHGWTTVGSRDLEDPSSLPPRTIAITFDDGYADNYTAFEALAERGMKASWYIVSEYIGDIASWTEMSAARLPLLNATQLREMAAAGMDIGSHTCSHCCLTQADEGTLVREVTVSKESLEDMLGQEVLHFAYPYGRFDERVVGAVRDAGYRLAFTTRTGWALRDKDPLRIRRVAVFANDSLSSFARKLSFADTDVSWRRISAYYMGRFQSRLGLGGTGV